MQTISGLVTHSFEERVTSPKNARAQEANYLLGVIKAAYDFAVLTWQQLSSFKRLGFSYCNVAGKTFFIDLLPLSREFCARRTCINNHPTLTNAKMKYNALLFTSAILILAPTVPWGLGRSQTEHVKLILQWPGCREKKNGGSGKQAFASFFFYLRQRRRKRDKKYAR